VPSSTERRGCIGSKSISGNATCTGTPSAIAASVLFSRALALNCARLLRSSVSGAFMTRPPPCEQGVAANATPRQVRGQIRKPLAKQGLRVRHA
jgi:hypothetical protein